MQLEFLSSLKLPSLVKQRLGMLPPNLQKIYEENYSQKLESYQEEERRIVVNAFQFLLCAQEKLSTGGFLKALSILDTEEEPLSPALLLDLCFNFLDVDSQLDVFQFAHLSVREYLESKSDYKWTSNHALAAECCVRLLSSEEVVERFGFVGHLVIEDVSDSEDAPSVKGACKTGADSEYEGLVKPELAAPINPTFWYGSALVLTDFHRYACIHWAFHLASSGEFRLVSPLKELSYAFIMDGQYATSKAYRAWSLAAYYYWQPTGDVYRSERLLAALGTESGPPAADYLFAACVWGFDDLVEVRLRAALNPTIGQVIYDSGRALHTASMFGNHTAVRLLLEHGADWEWTETKTEIW